MEEAPAGARTPLISRQLKTSAIVSVVICNDAPGTYLAKDNFKTELALETWTRSSMKLLERI